VAALLALLRAQSAQLRAETAELRAAQAAAHGAFGNSGGGNGKAEGGSRTGSGGSSGGGSSGGGGSGARGSGGGGSGSGAGGNATPLLQTSSTRLVVTVDLDASKQTEASVGKRVTVEMPNGNMVNGTVTAVSSVAQSSSAGSGGSNSGSSGAGSGNGGDSGSATIPVTIALSRHLSGAGLDAAAVSVNFARAEANHVLSVPVTALLATSGGGYAVQEAAMPHRLIPVTTGLFAAGDVQISGRGIYPGLEVTESQG
jgi:hypothetical protein